MRRPVGVVVSCVLLGFAAFTLLMVAVLFLCLSTMMGRVPIPTQSGHPTPDAGVMAGVMIGLGLITLIPLAWVTVTTVGLARMKTWARYSIIVIGVCLAGFGLLFVLGTILSQALMASSPMAAAQNPAALRFGMIVNGVMALMMIGIGIWWVVYFSRSSTRDAFALASTPQAVAVPGYIPPPSPYAASSYDVASYIPEPDPHAPPITSPVLMLDQTVAEAATPPGRPITITVIAILMILGLVFTIPYAFTPFPMFIFGTVLSGWSAHLAMAGFALASGLAGIGLLQMKQPALYLAYAVYSVGLLNCATMLLPSVRAHMLIYQHDLMQKMATGTPQMVDFNTQMVSLIIIPAMIFSVILCIVLLILLFINRAAFDRTDDRTAQAAAL
jgi:hypothetical protein